MPINSQIYLESSSNAINEYMRRATIEGLTGRKSSADKIGNWEININMDTGTVFHLEEKK